MMDVDAPKKVRIRNPGRRQMAFACRGRLFWNTYAKGGLVYKESSRKRRGLHE